MKYLLFTLNILSIPIIAIFGCAIEDRGFHESRNKYIDRFKLLLKEI